MKEGEGEEDQSEDRGPLGCWYPSLVHPNWAYAGMPEPCCLGEGERRRK